MRKADSKEVHAALDKLKQSHTAYTVNDMVMIVINNRAHEEFTLKNISIHLCFLFWNVLNADMTNSLRNKISIYESNEKVGEVSLITRKSLWFLNGEAVLDGSRTLNAEYRKEAL